MGKGTFGKGAGTSYSFGKGPGMMVVSKGKGKDKDKGKANPLNDIEPSLKVWIGGIPEEVTWKELQEHFEIVGKCRWAEILPKGVGCVAYKTQEEAENAIAELNGSELGGAAIEVDTWDKKPSKGGAKSTGKGKSKTSSWIPVRTVWQPMVQRPMFGTMAKGKGAFAVQAVKGKGKGKAKGKGKDINKIDSSKKVWVGNVVAEVKWKELEELFKTVGETPWVEILPKGVACVCFKTDDEAAAALGLAGSELGGEAIEVDVWEKKPKKGKGADA